MSSLSSAECDVAKTRLSEVGAFILAIERQKKDIAARPSASDASELASRLAEVEPQLKSHPEAFAAWKELRREWLVELVTSPGNSQALSRVQSWYWRVSKTLRGEGVSIPPLRTQRTPRIWFHVTGALVFVALDIALTNTFWRPWLFVSLALGSFLLEWIRSQIKPLNQFLVRLFGPVVHGHEAHSITSGTWFASGYAIACWLPNPYARIIALVSLGIGDPTARYFGRRFGTHRFANGKSWEGLAAAAVASALVAVAFGLAFGLVTGTSASLLSLTIACAVGGLSGACAETFIQRIDDNVTVPSAAGLASWIVLALLDLPG